MGIDPINRILLGSKFPKMVHGPIRPHYLHAPNLAVLRWQKRAHRVRLGVGDDTTLTHGGHFLELT